ncbi:MAG: zf-TFIIB domain-containing protein [Planctomycetota bacterium]
MRSPIDPDVVMETVSLDDGPTVMRCPKSGGIWIRPTAFWSWLEQHSEDEPAIAEDVGEIEDSPAGKRCPEDGRFLTRRKVGHGCEFYVERCPHCGGFWLDAGEWETLRANGLAKQLHHVFSNAWQARLREQRQRDLADERLEATLGESDTAKVRAFADFVRNHPHRDRILGFIA